MSNYIPLQIKTHYSLLHSTIKAENLAESLKEKNISAAAITDYGSLSGCVQFCQKMGAAKIKPILGITLYICPQDPTIHKDETNSHYGYLTLLAKNKDGWKELLKIVAYSNHPDRFDKKNLRPRLSLKNLVENFNTSNLFCICGGTGSILANELFTDTKLAYNLSSEDDVRGLVHPNWHDRVKETLDILKSSFGDRFYLEIALDAPSFFPSQFIIAKCWRELNIQKVACQNAHYLNKDDSVDQRVLLCSYMRKTMKEVPAVVANYDQHDLGQFFACSQFFLRDSLDSTYTEEEIKNTIDIASQCDEYSILSKPTLPHFKCPDGKTEAETLRELCRNIWKKKCGKIKKELWPKYGERVNYELSVIESMGFSGYFLILNDILNFARNKGYFTNNSRGSAGGCLVSYLSEITYTDPIKHNLYFERFLNPARVGVPDIDLDFPVQSREIILDYIKSTYGENRVYQIATYQNLKGRSAIKEVLRCYGGISQEEMNKITESIPDPAKIAGELQEMRDNDEEASIILWTLQNKPEDLREWCHLDENGDLQGPLSRRFEQAIRLEDIKKSQGKHACGLIIAPVDCVEVCPLIYDKSNDILIGGLDMNEMEAIGLVKVDILGLAALDKLMKVKELLLEG